jgi:hypothetical protein
MAWILSSETYDVCHRLHFKVIHPAGMFLLAFISGQDRRAMETNAEASDCLGNWFGYNWAFDSVRRNLFDCFGHQ